VGDAIANIPELLQGLTGVEVYGTAFAILLLCGLGLPIPEDVILVTVGYATYLALPGTHITLSLGLGMAGVLLGDSIAWTLGHRFGIPVTRRWPFRLKLGPARLVAAREHMHRHRRYILFAARFMPGLRVVVFFTAGLLGVRYTYFLLLDGLAAMLSVPALVVSSWYFGAELDRVIRTARQAENALVVAIVVIVIYVLARAWLRRRKLRAEEAEMAAKAAALDAEAASSVDTPGHVG